MYLTRIDVDPQGTESAWRAVRFGAHLRRLTLRTSGSAHHRAHPGYQLAWAERLGDVVVGPDRQTHDGVEFRVACGQHHDVGIGEGAKAPAHLDTVDARQSDV